MRPPEILSRLGGFTGRGPGTDSKRRAARWLATQLGQTARAVTAEAWLRETTRGLTTGWLGWLCIAIAWVLVIAILRLEGHTGQTIGAVQFPPTVALVLAVALLVDIATADFGPAVGDDASGVAVAVALMRALDAAPPANLSVELVLEGAGEGPRIGLRHHLRARRADAKPADTIV